MTPSQIITQDVQQVGGNADEMLRKINKLVQAKAAILLQENDSVLLIINIAKGAAEIHLFSVDNPFSLVKAMKVFWKKITDSDLKKVYIDDTNSKLLDASKKADWNIQKSNMPNYVAMVTVGNK